MKTFTDYFNEDERVYEYTVKVAMAPGQFTDDHERAIEDNLSRLDIVNMGAFKMTPIQESPLDFPNVHNVPVHIADFSVKYPSSTDMLERMIAETLGCARCCVVVYTENDPRKTYTKEYLERKMKDRDYMPVTGLPPQANEHGETPKYGEDYIEEFMDQHQKKVDSREVVEVYNQLSLERKIETPDNYGKDMGSHGNESPLSQETRTK